MASSTPIVERLQMTFKPDTDIPEIIRTLNAALLIPRPAGSGLAMWGLVEEDPTKAELWMVWDSFDQHMAFAHSGKADISGVIMGPVLAARPILYHIAITSELLPLPSNAIAEIVTFWPAPKSVEFLSGDDEPEGFLGQVNGHAVEEVNFGGENHKALVAVVGWENSDGKGAKKEIEGYKLEFDEGEGTSPNVERCHVKFQLLQ